MMMMIIIIIVIGFNTTDVYCYIDCYSMCAFLYHYHVFAIVMTIINAIIITNDFCHYYYYIFSHVCRITIFWRRPLRNPRQTRRQVFW